MTNYDYMSGYGSGILNLLDNFDGDIEAYTKAVNEYNTTFIKGLNELNTSYVGTTIDSSRPSATIVLNKSSLSVSETAQVTIKFNEKVSYFSNNDLTITGGTLSALASSDNITWTGMFTPTANSTTTGKITLNANGYTDIAGNLGSSAISSNITINTIPADTLSPTATITLSDTSLIAGQKAQVNIVFNEAVTDLTVNDFILNNAILSNLSSNDGINWTADVTADNKTGSAEIKLGSGLYSDLAGNTNTSLSSKSFSIEQVNILDPNNDGSLWDSVIQKLDGSTVDASASQLYRSYYGAMGRLPDQAGFNWWLNEIKEGRYTLQSMADGFIYSAEFLSLADT